MQISSLSTPVFDPEAAISWHLENHHAPHHAARFTADKRAEALAAVVTMPNADARGWLRAFVDETCLADVDVFIIDPSWSDAEVEASLQASARTSALVEYGVTTVEKLQALVDREIAGTPTPEDEREAAMRADIDRMFAEEVARGTYGRRFPSFDEWLKRRDAESPETEPAADEQAKAEPVAEEQQGRERKREREPMFKRIGALKASPREWLIKGFLARNEVGNPFGRPDSFKGVTAAQLCVHIAGGVRFLDMDVKQAPAAYFAAERGEQAKRRIKGHIQRLGLADDLPCYFGSRPINLLNDGDVDHP